MYGPFSIEGKVTIVTGGGIGIGAAVAREFALAGAPVLIASRKIENLEATRDAIRKDGGTIELKVCDATKQEDCHAIITEALRLYGHLDVMINNAGGNIRSVPLEITAEDMHTLFATNYDSMFYCSQASARQFVAQKTGGCIINFSSVCGLVGWPDTSAIYGSTKAAIINLTEALALEWAPLGIRVNAICPGPILVPKYEAISSFVELMPKHTPLGRWGRPQEIAYACVFLASDAAAFISGTNLRVDGGPSFPIKLEGVLSGRGL
jgi:NAD(P)-dependent dehydrogenase (short-subunit alcohol dehydrogenase family)